jgi:hypothetical protein
LTNSQKKEIVTDSYQNFLADLRKQERDIVVAKRSQEFSRYLLESTVLQLDRTRPAAPGWYDLKDHQFTEEIQRYNRDQK